MLSMLISVYYCLSTNKIWHCTINLPEGSTIIHALKDSGIMLAFPNLDPWKNGIGIFGEKKNADFILSDNDRVELYSPLIFDPTESRKKRAYLKKIKKSSQNS